MLDPGTTLAAAIAEIKAFRPNETREVVSRFALTGVNADLSVDWQAWLVIQTFGLTSRIHLLGRRVQFGIPGEDFEAISTAELAGLFVDISTEGIVGGILISESPRRVAFVDARAIGLQAALADGPGPKFASVLDRLRAAARQPQQQDTMGGIVEPRPVANTPLRRSDVADEYNRHLSNWRREHEGRYPSRGDDYQWGREIGLQHDLRGRIKDLRKRYIPAKIRVGGHPKKPGK
jgi:hypothetical protein